MDPCKNPKQDERKSDDEESYLDKMYDADEVLTEDVEEDEKRNGFELETLLDSPSGATLDTRQYDERDYQSHRRESFPHSRHHHPPNTSLQSPTKRASVSAKPSSEESGIGIGSNITDELESLIVSSVVSSVFSPVVNVNPYQDLTTESPQKKVQFEIGGGNPEESQPPHEKKKHHRRHHHHHHHPKLEDGSRQRAPDMQNSSAVASSLDFDPDVDEMDDLDQENLSSHRFSDNKGYRRHKYLSKFQEENIGNNSANKGIKYDHQPHEIFVELDVLTGHGEHREWKEAARWIKYEEDVEEGANRWGRPHVASLSFHSLINLRRLLETGVTLLDLEERDLPGVAYRSVEAMVVQELIRPEERAMVMRALLLKHKHVNENDGWRFNLRRNTTSGSLTSLHAAIEQDRQRSFKASGAQASTVPEGLSNTGQKMPRRNSAASRLIHETNGGNNDHGILIEDDFPSPLHYQHSGEAKLSLSNLSEEDVKWVLNKENLLRRIPVGAEASIVLVGKDEKLKRPIMAFIRLAESSYMPNITELPIPVRFIYILLGPSSYDLDYKEIGRSISTLMSNRHFHEIAYKAHDRRDMLKGIHDFLDESIVLPPGDWDNELFPFEEMKEKSQMLRKRKEKRRQSSVGLRRGLSFTDDGDGKKPPHDIIEQFDPLKRTKKLFGGMRNDIARRYKLYLSDIKDGINFQVVATILFIYFACVSGAIAFGGILGDKTEKHIGISETLIATSAAGILFAIFSGQPLIIVGTTGPLLLFDESLYNICKTNDIDFLAFRFWIGIWVMAIGFFVVCFDGSVIARFFSRFVCEIFSSLISLLFIFDAVVNIIKVYSKHPLRHTYGNCSVNGVVQVHDVPYPNTALLSTVLCLGTFAIAYTLRSLRTGGYFTPMARKFLSNFAVPIAIIAMVGMDFALKNSTRTEKLNVPEGLENSKPRSSWFVDISSTSVLMAFLACVPAALVFILMFMETSICSLIIGKKEMKLKKGGGYHLDIFLICIINGAIASIGGCWTCAATVRACAHASSLTVYSTNNPPGEKPTIIGVKEQRVSSFIISVLVGLSVLISPALTLIPMSVLFGVFLYMGISSMSGVQFFERVSLLFKQVSSHPQVPYVRRVKTSKMHLFTIIQILCLVTLFAVKMTPGALSFPFLLILLVPLRLFVLKAMFKPSELAALDGKGGDEDKEATQKSSIETIPVLTLKEHIQRVIPEKSALMDHIDGDESMTIHEESPAKENGLNNGSVTT